MTDDYVLNFGIKCKRPIDLQSAATSDFLDKLSDAAPTLDRIDEDTEKGTISLFEEGRLRRPRQIEIKSDGVQSEAGSEITLEERHEFLRIVATAAESLKIDKRQVNVVDLRVMFRIKHWGNHSDLAAEALWKPGPLHKMVQAFGTPLKDVSIGFQTSPPERDEFVIALTVAPQTELREIRSGEYDGDELVIMCAVARTKGFLRVGSFSDTLSELEDIWTKTASKPIMDNVVAALKGSAVTERPRDRS